jgi:hypothetical protein
VAVGVVGRGRVVGDGRFADLDVRGEDRIGGRERGAEERRAGRGQAEQRPSGDRHGGDRQRHRDREQPPRRAPASHADGSVDAQPGAGERHDHAELGQSFGELDVLDRVGEWQAERQPEHHHADDHQHDGE